MAKGTWEGGRYHEARDGTVTYYIRRRVAGEQVEVKIPARDAAGAISHLRRFEIDPAAYMATMKPGPRAVPLLLDAALVKQFLKDKTAEGVTAPYLRDLRRYLADWGDDLDGRDLRHLDLGADLVPALDRRGSRLHRTAALRALTAWLRQRGLLKRDTDATLDLPVPSPKPAITSQQKGVERERFDAVVAKMPGGPARDLVRLLGDTGMHFTEALRFAKGGTVEEVKAKRGDGATHTVRIPIHKNREPLLVAVGPGIAECAQRIRKSGTVNRANATKAVKRAAVVAEVKPFTLGVLRHSVAEWARRAGQDERTSRFLGHRSAQTTARFYAGRVAPLRPLPADGQGADGGTDAGT